MLRRWLVFVPALVLAGRAWGQATLRPDPTPRLPPQAGQGLPVEDRRFLRDALALSRAQEAAATRAARRGGEVGRLAGTIAERHRALAQQLDGLARRYGVAAPGGEESGVAEALRRLSAPGEDERGFLAATLEAYPVLAQLHQSEASQSTDRDLARVAITALAGIQEDYAAATRLAAPLGVLPPPGTVPNPPQYGTKSPG